MKIIKNASQMQKIALRHIKDGDEIGLVPTMGALHEGHISLIAKSVKNDDITIVSIFVNPIQFGPNEDYLKYPRPVKKDKEICKKNHVDYVFMPSVNDMFPADHKTFIEVKTLQDILCGAFRINHFKGVATVIAKLFNISCADRAYFGMKDFQQLKIIEKMGKDLNFRTKIIPCSIVRERNGLALSSRNSYLSAEGKKRSLNISKSLKEAAEDFKRRDLNFVKKTVINKLKKIPGSEIDYAEIVNFDDLLPADKNTKKAVFAVAVWIGKTRLIDNIMMIKDKDS
ncbi:pantothenate synthetase [Endomicrobiia bacterium]|nr:pantothenate synthetase [Endomicrobiia bacterium]GHT12763.1 pantothenate synthetase [Endomicrobiia bacterium]GHT20102.1 pantothenate synthetase [Endomicrobiia bacterium]GHT27707.1 pantothenate synthetase [Endomicrobiia bacterium]GHT30329.1 pantothenate synthetase [Endomicrobiia bacterium]